MRLALALCVALFWLILAAGALLEWRWGGF